MWRGLLVKVHISWHLAWLAAGILSGIVFGRHVSIDEASLIFSGIVLVVVMASRRWRILAIAALCAGFLFGMARAARAESQVFIVSRYYGQIVELRGIVAEDPGWGRRGDQRLDITLRQISNQRIRGSVWVNTTSRAVVLRGDTVIIRGKLRPGFGGFAASMPQAQVVTVMRPHPGDMARQGRDWFAAGIRRAIDEPQAALGIGYLTGQQTALPPELDDQLRSVGLTHAVVASGYNLTILVSFARSLLLGVSKYLATMCAVGMILGFMAVTGLSPSMARAGLVAAIGLAVWYYGRSVHPVVLLLVAAALTALYNPAFIWGELGWYLSFAAFSGVMLLSPLIVRYFWGDESPNAFWRLVVETLSAQIVTLPIILYAFGVVAMYALPANVLVVPLIPAAMLLVFVGGLAGVIVPTAAHTIGVPAQAVLKYMTEVITYTASLPGATVELAISVVGLALCYVILAITALWLYRVTGHNFRE
ncbi:MAG TPA: ComEC/Rec2 family competence protein [Candidatus Saccharimonadales bacterium]